MCVCACMYVRMAILEQLHMYVCIDICQMSMSVCHHHVELEPSLQLIIPSHLSSYSKITDIITIDHQFRVAHGAVMFLCFFLMQIGF